MLLKKQDINKLKDIFIKLLNQKDVKFDNLQLGTKNWDSLKHMNLITALEEEFDVIFDDQEIVDSMNYALIVSILKFK